MKEGPLVSVIIPAYNAQKYIREALDSVLAQTYSSFEIIVVEDSSTDDTAKIIKSYIDPRVKFVHQEKKGQTAARDEGMRRASGKYLAFLDADDVYLPQKLERQVGYMEAHPECGLCYCDLYHFFADTPD